MAMMRSVASAIPIPVFLRECVSLAETPMQSSSTPAASARSRPRSFRTSAERATPVRPPQLREQPVGVGHLRHLLRVHERADLHHVHAGRDQRADPAQLLLRRDDLPLHLQPVPRPHLVEDDLPRRRRHAPQPLSARATASATSSVVLVPPMS